MYNQIPRKTSASLLSRDGTRRRHFLLRETSLLAATALAGTATRAQQPRPAASNPFDPTVQAAPHLEPAIPRPQQEQAVRAKLDALKARTGRPPNVLIFLVDDMGWGDVGAFGGGHLIGAPTPNIDALAANGLKLVSTYTQPTCTPARAALMTGRIPTRSGLTRRMKSQRPACSPTPAVRPHCPASGILAKAKGSIPIRSGMTSTTAS